MKASTMKQVLIDLRLKEYQESEGEGRQLNSDSRRLAVFGTENELSKCVIVSALPFPYL